MSLWRGTLCTNCKKEHECAEAERMFKSSGIAYGCSACVPKPTTNADRIRAMTDEELAEYFDGVCHDLWQMFVKDPQKMWLDWLKQEAE